MASGRHGRLPRSRMRDRAARGPAVAGGNGHENSRVCRVEKRDFSGMKEVRYRAGDGVVNHVNAIRDCLINGRREIRTKTTGGAVALVPEGFVHRHSSARRHSAEAKGRRRNLNGVVAPGRRSGVSAVAVIIARGEELPWELFRDPGVTAPTRVVVARSDQLLVAKIRVPGAIRLAVRLTLAMPAGNLLENKFPTGIAVVEARAFGPDAGVDNTDNHAFAGAARFFVAGSTELVPQPIRRVEAEEMRGRGSCGGHHFIGRHSDRVRWLRQPSGLIRR